MAPAKDALSNDPSLDQSALVRRLRTGSREAFEELVRLYQADVRVMVRRHLGNTVEADEVAQEVFLQVFRGLATFRGEGSLRAWILGITRNQVRTHFRNKSRRKRHNEMLVSPELLAIQATIDDEDPFAFENARQDLRALEECLRRLEEGQRSVIHEFYFRKQSAESIARQLGQSAGAVRMLLLRIRKRLGKCIRKRLTTNGGKHD